MCKYKMDLANIVEDTGWTRFCPQTDGQTDRRMDKVKPVYLPFNFVEAVGIITFCFIVLYATPPKINLMSEILEEVEKYYYPSVCTEGQTHETMTIPVSTDNSPG